MSSDGGGAGGAGADGGGLRRRGGGGPVSGRAAQRRVSSWIVGRGVVRALWGGEGGGRQLPAPRALTGRGAHFTTASEKSGGGGLLLRNGVFGLYIL